MAEADLVSVIRQTAKAQNKVLLEAAKKRHGQLMAKAASAKDKEAKAQLKLLARSTMEHATATAKRLRNSAENAADSYARAIKKVVEAPPVKKSAKAKDD